MIRLFVGIGLPTRVRTEIAAVQAGLPRARWVRPENLHVTVRFVGDVDKDMAEDIHVALSGLRAPAFELAIRGLGQFESGGRVRTVWAGVEGAEPLVFLRDKVESALVRLGLPAERRKFTPHVTLARFNGEPAQNFFKYFESHAALAIGAFSVRSFILFRSLNDADGVYYEPVEQYPLDGFPGAATLDDDSGPEWGWDGADDAELDDPFGPDPAVHRHKV